MIVLRDVNDFKKDVLYCSDKSDWKGVDGKQIGTFERDVDGFYYFWNNDDGGCWGEYSLRLVADALEKLNKPWNEQIQNDLKI